MFRPMSLLLLPVVAAALLASACGSSSTPSAPTTTPTQLTDTFSDTLTVNGGVTFPFGVQQTGTITATLTALAPDPSVTVGLLLGTWNGAACSISAGSSGIINDAAVLNTSITGSATGTGNFCVRVYDVGKLTAPTTFTVSIVHF